MGSKIINIGGKSYCLKKQKLANHVKGCTYVNLIVCILAKLLGTVPLRLLKLKSMQEKYNMEGGQKRENLKKET